MPKSRSTIPIVHADNVPTIAFTDEEWQAIEHTFGQQLNADVRQQITTVTAQYCKDCVFEPAAPKEIALKRIERVRRAAGDLERLIFDRETGANVMIFNCKKMPGHTNAPGSFEGTCYAYTRAPQEAQQQF